MTFTDGNLSAKRSTVFVALGSNLDHPVLHVQRALREIDELPETALVKISALYETVPVGVLDQPPFVNAVAQIATTLSPHDFLARLHAIEAQHGRLRNSATEEKNGPRTLDLDILLFDELTISERGLTIPHQRMHERAFVLVPLLEIAPDVVIPGRGAAKKCLATLDIAGVGPPKYEVQ
ncbi:MAG: 2-amino-4-hydroxy-6-hydroxymethyldihydropteridine diphosphokinase [Burkholderiales bacterium]|nr:2-amino-4-hydroxy-6-hydroxymethyldihydropteridine diphosphokinase [Burkholderiales bacterium]